MVWNRFKSKNTVLIHKWGLKRSCYEPIYPLILLSRSERWCRLHAPPLQVLCILWELLDASHGYWFLIVVAKLTSAEIACRGPPNDHFRSIVSHFWRSADTEGQRCGRKMGKNIPNSFPRSLDALCNCRGRYFLTGEAADREPRFRCSCVTRRLQIEAK